MMFNECIYKKNIICIVNIKEVVQMLQYDNELDIYTLELEEIIFSWEEEPEGDFVTQAKKVANNYKNNLSKIIEFIHTDIQEMYGDISIDDIKEKLGKPIIDINNGQVTYCEQTFDNIHIFLFEFLDEGFNEIQYFIIDG